MTESFYQPDVRLELWLQALAAYHPFIDQGIRNPADLNLSDPEVIKAHKCFEDWSAILDAKAQGDRKAEHAANFEKTIFYYAVGFTDPVYLEDVLDWLDQDLENVDESSEDPIPELAERIRAKVLEIKACIERKGEHIPTPAEVREVFKRLTGKEYKETKKVEDELGLYILEVETPGTGSGDVDEYGYRRQKTYNEGEKSKTEICVTYYSDGVPMSGQDVAKYIDGKWVISVEVYPGVSEETLKNLRLAEIGHNVSRATSDQRKIIFERLIAERDEKWASEALEANQPFSVEEQELLVSIVSDPYLSFEVLTVDSIENKKLTAEQREKLMTQIEADENVAQSFYLQLVESGVSTEPNEIEKWWIGRLEKLLAQTNDSEIAAYALEHNTSLTEADRKRLEDITN